MMILGELKYYIIVKSLTSARDANNGSIIQSWATKYNLKAKIVKTSGSKIINNNEFFNSQNIVFQTHFRNIVETDRILYNNYNYKILFLQEIGYKEGLEIICEKIND